jgi:transcriptional regulator with XRE-family HTH domain
MDTLQEYLKKVMKEKQLSGVDIEKRSGGKIGDSYISKILRGQSKNLTVEKINALAEGLGVDSVDLFRAASGYKTDFKSVDDQWMGHILLRFMERIVIDSNLTRIAKAVAQMKPKEIKNILGIIESKKKG